MHCSLFPISHFCVYSAVRHKLENFRSYVEYRRIISEKFPVWFRVALQVQLESYGLRHASVGRSLIYHIVCVYCKSASLQVALWRGNATLWLHRQPTLPPLVDGLHRRRNSFVFGGLENARNFLIKILIFMTHEGQRTARAKYRKRGNFPGQNIFRVNFQRAKFSRARSPWILNLYW